MGVVARDTRQRSVALDITSTGLHLLDMADRFGGLVLFDIGTVNKRRPDVGNRVARAKISGVAAGPQDFKLALKVALVADVVPLDGIELGRINDRIGLTTCCFACVMKMNMFGPWSMAPLATDSGLDHNRLFISGELQVFTGHCRGLAAVASQATIGNGP